MINRAGVSVYRMQDYEGVKRFLKSLFSLKYMKLYMEYNHSYTKSKTTRYK
jgi:hypothetical protein